MRSPGICCILTPVSCFPTCPNVFAQPVFWVPHLPPSVLLWCGVVSAESPIFFLIFSKTDTGWVLRECGLRPLPFHLAEAPSATESNNPQWIICIVSLHLFLSVFCHPALMRMTCTLLWLWLCDIVLLYCCTVVLLYCSGGRGRGRGGRVFNSLSEVYTVHTSTTEAYAIK